MRKSMHDSSFSAGLPLEMPTSGLFPHSNASVGAKGKCIFCTTLKQYWWSPAPSYESTIALPSHDNPNVSVPKCSAYFFLLCSGIYLVDQAQALIRPSWIQVKLRSTAIFGTQIAPYYRIATREFGAPKGLPYTPRQYLRTTSKCKADEQIRAPATKCLPAQVARFTALAGGLAAIVGFLAIVCVPATARVSTEKLESKLLLPNTAGSCTSHPAL